MTSRGKKGRKLTPPNYYKVIKLGIELGDGSKCMSCKDIAAFLEVGDRTVYRYIATLREDFGAPIILIRAKPSAIYACSSPWSMVDTLKAC